MPYGPRIVDPDGGTYHVICRGNNGMDIFRDDHDFLALLSIIKNCKKTFPFLLHHYVVMTNHIHLLLSQSTPHSLAKIMKTINHGYALYHKKKYDFTGHLWQGRFKSYLVTNDRYSLHCAAYIELNPYRAGMVDDPSKYRWSSYHYYATDKQDSLINVSESYLALGMGPKERRVAYMEMVRGWMDRPMDKASARSFFKKCDVR